MAFNEFQLVHSEFLERWTLDNVKNLTLNEYVNVGNKDTFCQWVETKTKLLGSINGFNSSKFGIYKRISSEIRPAKFQNDDIHSWLSHYGNSSESAFQNIKKDVIKVINLSIGGKFLDIDAIPLNDFFKWKLAFLYSNDRLIPIFKRDVLLRIAANYQLNLAKHKPISTIQEIMILKKPSQKSVYEFMHQLLDRFGSVNKDLEIKAKEKSKRLFRKPEKEKNTRSQIRSGYNSYIADQKHNKIQEVLKDRLINQYGLENVIIEENFVDVKLIQPDYIIFYEVKSSSYASDCVKEALGQILFYSSHDCDKRQKKHVIVGQFMPNEDDTKYIDYIKQSLNLQFEYLCVDIGESLISGANFPTI